MAGILKVRESPIHGLGVFAGVDLVPGVSVPVPFSKMAKDDGDPHNLDTTDGLVKLFRPFAFLNHSDKPNAELFEPHEGGLFLEVTEIIRTGEEVTIDYGEGWSDTCP